MLKFKSYSNIATLKQGKIAHKYREHSISITGIVDHKTGHNNKDKDEIIENKKC